MIRKVEQADIGECVEVIRKSFGTVADEFGFTIENAPRFTAFATTEERINWHLNGEHRPMYAYWENGAIIGYYSLLVQDNNECELNNVCVLPKYRHKGIGEKLLKHAFSVAVGLGCTKMNIGIVEDKEEGGFVVSYPDLPGCITCGETIESAVENALDAKRIWLEAAPEEGIKIHESILCLSSF